jgi:hypothetical protein
VAHPFAPWRRVALEEGAPPPEPLPGAYSEFPHLALEAELFIGLTRAGYSWADAQLTDLWLLGVLVGADGVDRSEPEQARHPWEASVPSDPDDVKPADPAVMAAFSGYLDRRRAQQQEEA